MKELHHPSQPNTDNHRRLLDNVTPAFLRRQWRTRRKKRYAVPVSA